MTPSSHQPMTDAQALAAVLAEDAVERSGEHPELDELTGYLADDLAPEAEARIQDHLVACRPCTARLLDLETLQPAAPRTPEGVADLALAAAWREQKTRIADLESTRRRQHTLHWVSAVAASFFVATLGLSVHVSQLRQTIAGLRAPAANVATVYLDGSATRSETEPEVLRVGADQRFAVLFVTPPRNPSFPQYEMEILDAAGSRVLQVSGLEPSEDYGNLRIGAPLERMPAGGYQVWLHGIDGDHREQLPMILLRVRYQ